jgi:hypothetical protein
MEPDSYFMTKDKYENDVEDFFFKSLKNKSTSLTVALLYARAIKDFFKENGVELPDEFWRKIDKKFGRSSIKSRGVEDLDPWGVGFGDA